MASRFAVALMFALCPATLNAQVSITSGFDTGDPWTSFSVISGTSVATIASTGGNPGRFADFNLNLQNATLGGAGFTWTGGPPLIVGSLTTLSISADYKYFSGPAPDLIPMLRQELRLYSPVSNIITLGTSPDWVSVGTHSYDIAGLVNSTTGIPFDPQAPAQLGFWVRLRSPVPATLSSRVGIDNITLQVIPAPATSAALVCLFVVGRRRANR